MNFEDLEMDDISVGEEENLTILASQLKASVFPKNGDVEDFDFEISLNDPNLGYLGGEGKDLMIKGSGIGANGEAFSFEADIERLRMELEKSEETDPEILKFNPNALNLAVQDLQFSIGELRSDYGDADFSLLLKEQVRSAVVDAYDGIWDGDMDKLSNLPVESFLPILLMKHLGTFAKQFEIAPHFLEYGFDPEMMFSRYRDGNPKKLDMLKEIKSEF